MTNLKVDFGVVPIRIQSGPEDSPVLTGQFSACGNYLALIRCGRPAAVYELFAGTRIELPTTGPAHRLAFNPIIPEIAVAVAGSTPHIERFDLRCPRLRPVSFTTRATCLSYTDDGRYLLAGDADGKLSLFDLDSSPAPKQLFSKRIAKEGIAVLSASGDKIVGSCDSSRLFKMELYDCGTAGLLPLEDGLLKHWDCYAAVGHPYLQRCAFGGTSRFIQVHEGPVRTQQSVFHRSSMQPAERSMGGIRVLETGMNYVYQIEFIPQLRQLAVVGDKGLEVYSTIDWKFIHRWNIPGGRIACVRPIGEEIFVAWT